MTFAPVSTQRQVADFNDAERLLLWALRHRVASGDPSSPHLVRAFDVLCGPTTGAAAHRALDRFVEVIDVYARRPLAFFDWCHRSVTEDEADLLDVCAYLQRGLQALAPLRRLVVAPGVEPTQVAATSLVSHLKAAGLHLPTPNRHPLMGEHDEQNAPHTLH